MKSSELATQVNKIHAEALGRILGVGHQSYASGPAELIPVGSATKVVVGEERQRFEDESFEDQMRGLEEELLDTINWASMTILKLRERVAQVNKMTAS